MIHGFTNIIIQGEIKVLYHTLERLRVMDEWKRLSGFIVKAESIRNFKNRLDNIFLN